MKGQSDDMSLAKHKKCASRAPYHRNIIQKRSSGGKVNGL